MSYSSKTGLDAFSTCKYYDPLTNNSNSCMRGNQCHFKHLTVPQFESFCYNQSPHTLREIAFCYQSAENFSCSNYVFNKLIEIDPKHAVNNFGFAQSFEGLKNYKSSETYYLHALSLSPNDDRCHSLYAQFLHTKLNDYKTAKKYYVNALSLNTNNPFTHCNYGKLLEDTNLFDDAEHHYEKCINISPKHRMCLYYLSIFYHYTKINLNKSKKYFDKLIRIISKKENKYWYDYYEYAKLLNDMKYFDESIINFKIALKHCENNIEKGNIYYEMGLVYDGKIFDVQSAKYYFNKAQEFNYKKYNVFYMEFCQHHKLQTNNSNQSNHSYNNKNNTNDNYNSNNTMNNNNNYMNQSNHENDNRNDNCNGNNMWNNNNNYRTNDVVNNNEYNNNNNNNSTNNWTDMNNNEYNNDQRPPHENNVYNTNGTSSGNNDYNVSPPHENKYNNNNKNNNNASNNYNEFKDNTNENKSNRSDNNNTYITNEKKYNMNNTNNYNTNNNYNTLNNWQDFNQNVPTTNETNYNMNNNNTTSNTIISNKKEYNANNTNNNNTLNKWEYEWAQNKTESNDNNNNNNALNPTISNKKEYNANNTNNNWKQFQENTPIANEGNNCEDFKENIGIVSEDTKSINSNKNIVIELSSPQTEFRIYLENMKLEMYYNKFVSFGYDSMRYLDILEDDILINEIKMNKIHIAYLKKQINKFIEQQNIFEVWLKKLGYDLYSEYCDVFEKNGIFNFESFYRIVQNKKCLIQIFGMNNEFDADFIWNNTPKQTRKLNKLQHLELQQEGV